MEKLAEEYKEWMVQFQRYKDSYFKKIKDIKDTGDFVEIEFKDKVLSILVKPVIADIKEVIAFSKEDERFKSLVVANTKKNLKMIIDNWEDICKNTKFNIYFINPVSSTEQKWILSPYTHNRITEKKNLKSGLSALFSQVEEAKVK